jgi:hypothetical protein
MLNGFDDIDYLQNIKEDIVAFADKSLLSIINFYAVMEASFEDKLK